MCLRAVKVVNGRRCWRSWICLTHPKWVSREIEGMRSTSVAPSKEIDLLCIDRDAPLLLSWALSFQIREDPIRTRDLLHFFGFYDHFLIS